MAEKNKANIAWWAVMLLTVLLLASLLVGCRSVEYVPVETVRVDSTVIHDTTLTVQLVPYKDSVAVADTTSYLSNPYAYSRATWSDGMLHHVLGIWPQSTGVVKVPYFIDRYRYVKVPEIVEVEKPLTRWQHIKLELGGWAFGGIILMAIIIVGWLVYKRIK